MHAIPAEISITQVNQPRMDPELARDTPVQLSEAYIKDHSGDRHADPLVTSAPFQMAT